jgi:23S rRNA (cytosine1962-C5)-methyltransferase
MHSAARWIKSDLAREIETAGTTAYRIASDNGVWAERFGESALISARLESQIPQLTEELECWSVSTGWIPQRVYRRLLVQEPGQKDIPLLISGPESSNTREIVTECGLNFEIDFSASYSPGLFLDQRANRLFLKNRRPKRVLNTFAYTCAFSVAAAAVGATTTSVDISKSSLQRGRRNFELNNLSLDGHRFIPEDVPTYLGRLLRRGEKFDVIILDPPTFGRGGVGKTFRVERDFEYLLEAAAQLAEPDAAILLSTNFTGWTERELVEQALAIFPKQTTFHTEPAPPDFFDESPSSTAWALLHER